MADAEAHRINLSDPVRVTGVVTDDDGERRIAFLADGKRRLLRKRRVRSQKSEFFSSWHRLEPVPVKEGF